MNNSRLVVRPATHEDCKGVKAIDPSRVEDGFDRLLWCFHQDVINEAKFTYLAEINGKIVAYCCGHVIDDGKVIVMREGRVLEGHQGQNIMGKLQKTMVQSAVIKFPNLERMMWTSGKKGDTERALSTHPNMKVLYQSNGELIRIHSSCLGEITTNSPSFLQLAEKYQISRILSHSKPEALKLLTEEIRLLRFAPQRPMIGWQPSGWHVSTLAKQLLNTDLLTSRNVETSEIEVFSFLSMTGCDAGLRLELEIYCDDKRKDAEDLVIGHILYGLKTMSTFYLGTQLSAFIHFPLNVNRNSVRRLLKSLDIKTWLDDWFGYMIEYALAHTKTVKSKV